MSDDVEADAGLGWRVTCGRIGWAVFAIAAAVVAMTAIELFAASIGLALHSPMSVEQADGIMIRARITLGVVAAVAVLAVIASRWGLFATTLPVLFVLFILTNGTLTTG